MLYVCLYRLPCGPNICWSMKNMIFERVLGWGCCLDKTAHSHVMGFTCRPKVSPITHAFAVINTIPLKAQQYATRRWCVPSRLKEKPCLKIMFTQDGGTMKVTESWKIKLTQHCEELRGSLSNLSFCVGQVVFQQAVSTVFLVLTSKIEIVVLLFIRVKLIIFFKIILYHITTYLTFSSQILCKTTVHVQI